jgi:hypothetical protein
MTQAPAFDHYYQVPFLDPEYTIKKLNFSIKNLRVQQSPGRDGINYLILRNFPNEVLETLLEIYNDISRASVFSEDWKKI